MHVTTSDTTSPLARFDGSSWTSLPAVEGAVHDVEATRDMVWIAMTGGVARGYRGGRLDIQESPGSMLLADTVRLHAITVDAFRNQVPGVVITWSSDSTAVATVDQGGLVTTTGGGTAHVTATALGGAADTVSVTVFASTAPTAPTDLAQYQVDNSTAIPVGGTANQTDVYFRGQATDYNNDAQIHLEYEVRPLGTAFSNVATHTSGTFGNGGSAATRIASLSRDVSYHW